MKVIWHESPEAIICAMYDHQVEPEDLPDCVMEGQDPDGNPDTMSLTEYADHMRENGYWGFVLYERDEMHLWAKPDTPPEALLFLVGHEIGHASGERLSDPVAEERRADSYGAAAAMAWEIVSKRQDGDYTLKQEERGDYIILASD